MTKYLKKPVTTTSASVGRIGRPRGRRRRQPCVSSRFAPSTSSAIAIAVCRKALVVERGGVGISLLWCVGGAVTLDRTLVLIRRFALLSFHAHHLI